jgi:hypothetical protein
MAHEPENHIDRLWGEYSEVFREFDDLTLARWLVQTLGQLEGKAWRLSHPLLAAYRLGAQIAHERQVWFKRLATHPPSYPEALCCRSPLLPLLTRDVLESGLICLHCNGTAVPLDDLSTEMQVLIRGWAEEYAEVHAVAHWDEAQQRACGDYDQAYEDAATKSETLLAYAGREILPKLLESYSTMAWEDQDECLEVRPENLKLD